ncbi:hypothetical protein [Tardiphaga sp. vice304]|uniref:hypothetical protein n=1 Tax=Tardiphaga sp. vice304 TaxID=2592817 RepID=UPI001AED575A|nr:hypothetical protein [Tardiphaga sp. vice304]
MIFMRTPFVRFSFGFLAVGIGIAGSASAADLSSRPVKAPTAVAEVAPNWVTSLNTEVQYYSWTGTLGTPVLANQAPYGAPASGSQVYIPTAVSLTGMMGTDLKLELTARSGYVWGQQKTPGEAGTASSATDTQLSTTVTYSGLNGLQPYFSLLMNLPTGSSALFGASRYARMDPDLVGISSYGEGFNIGPTVGVNIPINSELLASISGGYTSRGNFNKESVFDPFFTTDRITPGDDATVTLSLGYASGAVSLQGSGSFTTTTPSLNNGVAQYKAGDRELLTLGGSYAWSDQWKSSMNAFWSHSDSISTASGGVFVLEPANSTSNVFRINSDTTYVFTNGSSLGPTASYLYRDRNGYDPTTFSFIPAKTRWSAGVQGGYVVASNFTLSGKVEHVWTRENDNPDKAIGGFVFPGTGAPLISSDGWALSLGGTVRF